jgi:hypothetical protein
MIYKLSFWFRLLMFSLWIGTFLASSYLMFSPFMAASYGLLVILGIAIISYLVCAISMVMILYYANKLLKSRKTNDNLY